MEGGGGRLHRGERGLDDWGVCVGRRVGLIVRGGGGKVRGGGTGDLVDVDVDAGGGIGVGVRYGGGVVFFVMFFIGVVIGSVEAVGGGTGGTGAGDVMLVGSRGVGANHREGRVRTGGRSVVGCG